MTSKLQVTIPKSIADDYGIEPGQEIQWLPAGDAIRVVPAHATGSQLAPAERLELFDQATQRIQRGPQPAPSSSEGRGWTRDELYVRGRVS